MILRAVTAVLLVACLACSGDETAAVSPGAGGDGGSGASGGAGGTAAGGAGGSGGKSTFACPDNRDAILISPVGGIDLMAEAYLVGDALHVVYERFDAEHTSAKLHRVVIDASGISASEALPIGNSTYTSTPTLVGRHLYFTDAMTFSDTPIIGRASIDEDFGSVQQVAPIAGVVRLQSFPRFAPLLGGGVGVAFHANQGAPSYAASTDGLHFDAPVALVNEAKAMARVTALGDGQLAFSYQTGAVPQISTVQRSSDGLSWTAPEPITSASQNVHDASALRRADGGLDLYYIYPPDSEGFVVYRRAYTTAGVLGPEERVTPEALGFEPSKPNAIRIQACGVLLLYAAITERDGQGYPSEQRLGMQWLDGDAPTP